MLRKVTRLVQKLFRTDWKIKYTVGKGTYGDPIILDWNEQSSLYVGNYCSIADEVAILLGGGHRTDWITTYPFSALRASAKDIKGHPSTKGDVVIGHDVWVGFGATILSGITIGNGAVIGAKAVVTKNVPPYAIVAGNPAKVIRYRFSDDDIQVLERLQWWNWSIEIIDQAMPILLDGDIEKLEQFYAELK